MNIDQNYRIAVKCCDNCKYASKSFGLPNQCTNPEKGDHIISPMHACDKWKEG